MEEISFCRSGKRFRKTEVDLRRVQMQCENLKETFSTGLTHTADLWYQALHAATVEPILVHPAFFTAPGEAANRAPFLSLRLL
jgi:hypothetical protein